MQKCLQAINMKMGNAIGGQIIGRGSYIMRHLAKIGPETGKGTPGPTWKIDNTLKVFGVLSILFWLSIDFGV